MPPAVRRTRSLPAALCFAQTTEDDLIAARAVLKRAIDAAYCSLDGFDYLPPENLPEVLRRLHLFIRPGGLLIFDIRTPASFEALDGEVFLDETDDVLCLWRADLTDGVMRFGMDLFEREGDLWSRESEEHVEYVHTPELLTDLLQQQGFGEIRITEDGPQGDQGRQFFIATRI